MQAILYSFQSSSVAMVDHHTLMQQFWEWHHKELATRGYSPGNWKWIIPRWLRTPPSATWASTSASLLAPQEAAVVSDPGSLECRLHC